MAKIRNAAKGEIVTFKADAALLAALEGAGNRSAFIRSAILAALDNTCPVCRGTGMLTPDQKRHWQRFAKNHTIHKCSECNALHLLCEHERQKPGRPT